MKKIMNTKEAIERVQTRFNKWALDEEDLTALQALGLVTIESEDERIRKALFHLINEQDGFLTAISGISVKDIIAYLEKQKEQNDVPSRETILGIWELGNFWKENPEERDGLTQLQYIQKYWFEKCDYLKEQEPAETSEDEKIVNLIKGIIMGAKRGSTLKIGAKSANDCIAYLEKQKLISDSLKAAGIYVRQDGSIERRTIPYLENQKEPRNYRKLYEDIIKSEWFKNAYEGKSLGGDDEQKLTEWSDEDEKALKRAINICESDFGENCETARFLKSLPERFNLLRKR